MKANDAVEADGPMVWQGWQVDEANDSCVTNAAKMKEAIATNAADVVNKANKANNKDEANKVNSAIIADELDKLNEAIEYAVKYADEFVVEYANDFVTVDDANDAADKANEANEYAKVQQW